MSDSPRDRLFELRETLNADAYATMLARNESYTTGDADPIENYRRAAEMAGIPVTKGILFRTAEKMVRMRIAAERGDIATVEEEAREMMNMVSLVAFAVGEEVASQPPSGH